MTDQFNEYIKEIAKVKDELEHSGRTFLQNLLTHFTSSENIDIIHEPKRDKQGRGAPDFKFSFNDTEVGYLENKAISENLDEILKSKQIAKYNTLTDNLILTNYIRWIWIYEGTVHTDITLCEYSELDKNKISLKKENREAVTKLIKDFLGGTTGEIVKAKDLAEKLSKPTRTIKEEIYSILKETEENENSKIKGVFKVLKSDVLESMTEEEFADAFAQTLTYSLFLTKISEANSPPLTLSNITERIPQSFALIKEILTFIKDIENYPQLKPYIERLLHIINSTNSTEITKDLQSNKGEFEDPYIHFYENFLTAYDKDKRKDLGVWYTPKPVVSSIINNIHDILKNDFNKPSGLADKNLKVLDFACGTGTFLFEIYDKILSEIPKNSLTIKNHLLKNIFGFELLIPAYAISHLKLSQHLKEKGFELEKDERIPVYFTNTLEERPKDPPLPNNFFPAIAKEGATAFNIKEDKEILVITGNPPYNGSSNNNFESIKNLIKPYFPHDEMTEKNPKWLQDDYVKFMRFAEHKIAAAGEGIVGIITNNSFIDNPTFRTMRKHLMDTFDKIYLIDLHGSTKKKEKSPDGSPDKNVFDIQQGVAISFFIKNSHIKDKGIYHLDIFGKREHKFKQISEINYQTSAFTKIEPSKPFYLFIPQNEKLKKDYEKGWSFRDIWQTTNVGIVTGKDSQMIAFNKQELTHKIKENLQNFNTQFIQNTSFRPFDTRKIYYDTKTKNLLMRARTDVMQHMTNRDNKGLCFIRNDQGAYYYYHFFISNEIIDLHLLGGGTYIAPLYLYQDSLGLEEKVPNFQQKFLDEINKKFSNPEPEKILGFIYAQLHSPTYRTKYLEFLKIDFPRINFEVSLDTFNRLSSLGSELIEAHLLQKIPASTLGEPSKEDDKENYMMEKVRYDDLKKRLYFNSSCYFADVSPEVWAFKIGGYQVLDKYLKSRKGMDISSDLSHIQNIIKVLDFTIKKMSEIDKV